MIAPCDWCILALRVTPLESNDAFVDAILAGQPEPQIYFSRMKRDNRLGAPVLGNLPDPKKLTAFELARIAESTSHLLVDTRLDRSEFMAHHVPGSICAPMNKSFNTVVGSLVVDETTPIVLIAEEEHIDDAVRDLIRIGYDNIVAYADATTLRHYFDEGGESASIEEIPRR